MELLLPLRVCIHGPCKLGRTPLRRAVQNRRNGYQRDRVVGAARSQKGEEGHPDVQEKLVEIVRLEMDKVRVSDYVQEKSKLLTDIAQQAFVESDMIANQALQGLDEASDKTIRAIDEDIQAMEDQLALARAELEAEQEELDAYEKRMQEARNEGLFFKGLYKPFKQWKDRAPEEQDAIKNEAKHVAETSKTLLGSKSRQNLYILLIGILCVFLIEAMMSDEVWLPGVISYNVLIVLLSIQLVVERFFISKKDDSMEEK